MIPSETRSGPLTEVELAAWRGMLRTTHELRAQLGRALASDHELSMAEYDLLVCLADAPGGRMRMADLADRILQPRSSLTRIAKALEARGLIGREAIAEDGRGACATLTRAGRAGFRRAHADHLRRVREHFLDRLDDEQLAALAGAWASLGTEPSP